MRRLLLVLVLAISACGGGEVIEAPVGGSDGLPSCDEVPTVSAPDDLYDDRPVYVGNEMPIDPVLAWATTQSGFESLWIDRDHNGWITVAFSDNAAEGQADVEERFPDAGVVVVEVDWTMDELLALQASIPGRFEPGFVQTTGISAPQGVVTVGIGPLTAERIAIAEQELAGEPVCLEGIDPELVPEPGPQPEVGEHWRLLADEKTGQAYRTMIATDQADLEALWREAGVSAPVPDFDFENEIVIWFGAVYGSSCPNLRMDDVVIEAGLVYPEIVNVDSPMACTADANPHAYVVAVERSALPAEGFVVQLQAEAPPPGVVDQQTTVLGDVTIPGSYVAGIREEIPTDPGLPGVKDGGVLEPGYPGTYQLYTHCGVEWLGEVNGVQWRAEQVDAPFDFVPDEWRGEVDGDQYLTVEILLTEGDPPVLEATVAGHTVRYLPATEDPPGCD